MGLMIGDKRSETPGLCDCWWISLSRYFFGFTALLKPPIGMIDPTAAFRSGDRKKGEDPCDRTLLHQQAATPLFSGILVIFSSKDSGPKHLWETVKGNLCNQDRESGRSSPWLLHSAVFKPKTSPVR